MQTTLTIDDDLYREAQAQAARQGTTFTRLLEEGLRLRMKKGWAAGGQPHSFRVYSTGQMDSRSWEETVRIANEEQNKQDLARLQVTAPEC